MNSEFLSRDEIARVGSRKKLSEFLALFVAILASFSGAVPALARERTEKTQWKVEAKWILTGTSGEGKDKMEWTLEAVSNFEGVWFDDKGEFIAEEVSRKKVAKVSQTKAARVPRAKAPEVSWMKVVKWKCSRFKGKKVPKPVFEQGSVYSKLAEGELPLDFDLFVMERAKNDKVWEKTEEKIYFPVSARPRTGRGIDIDRDKLKGTKDFTRSFKWKEFDEKKKMDLEVELIVNFKPHKGKVVFTQ